MIKSLRKFALIFAGPTVIAFAIAFAVPFVVGLYLSFCDFTTVTNATWVGLDNYIRPSPRGSSSSTLGFTSLVTAVSVVTVNLFAFAIAYLLTRKLRGTNFFRTVFFMPNLIGGIVLGYTWQTIINAVLVQYQTTLISEARYGFIGLVLLINWQMIGYMMIIYIAGLQNVPTELIRPPRSTAQPWQTLRNVTIPMVMPSITICLFLTLSSSFKLYDANWRSPTALMRQTEMVRSTSSTRSSRVGSRVS